MSRVPEPSIEELIRRLRSVRIEEAHIIDQIEQARFRERLGGLAERAQGPVREGGAEAPATFQVGDRIWVTNGVRAGQVPSGIVTKVGTVRIDILTDNGVRIWRSRNNVERE